MLLSFVCHNLVFDSVCSHLAHTSKILQLCTTSTSPSKAVQGLTELAEWSGHCMHMATSIGRVAAAAASAAAGWPQINGLQDGVICPCCNSLSCTSLAAGRKAAMQAYEEQAQQFRHMSATLKHSFQTVLFGTPGVQWGPLPTAAHNRLRVILVLHVHVCSLLCHLPVHHLCVPCV